MISKEKFDNVIELMEVEQEQLQLAIKVVENLAEDNFSKYPDDIKSKISNALVLLNEIDELYSEALQEDYEDYKEVGEEQ